jgi:hypothetical protein
MNAVLCGIAVLLMFVSVAMFFRHNVASTNQESPSDKSKHHPLLTLLVVSGTLIAFGGFWIGWMLWVGLILIELGCIFYYAPSKRPSDS